MKISKKLVYSFDDVLLVPQYSNIASRSDVDISTTLGKMRLSLPIVSANMDTVTEANMAIAMARAGGAGILHRFAPLADQSLWLQSLRAADLSPRIISVGLDVKFGDIKTITDEYGVDAVCVDVAHGDHQRVVETVRKLRAELSDKIDIIAGNVATGDAAIRLVNAGANIIKLGIGPGCHKAGTRILMSNGFYKNIEDVRAGDYVINMNGDPAMVKRSFSTGVRDVIGIRNSIWGDTTLVTPDHKYYVGDLSTVSRSTLSAMGYVAVLNHKAKTTPKQSKLQWKEIGKGGCAPLMPRRIKFEIKDSFDYTIKHRTEGSVVLTPSYDLGYIFGTFLGDGNAHHDDKNRTGSIHWAFGSHELSIANKLVIAIKAIFNRDCKIEKRVNVILVHFYHKPFADFLNTFGKRTSKALPEDLLVSNRSYLDGLRDGLIDSDGHEEKGGRINFANTSPRLTELFGVITYLLDGVWPNVEYRKPTSGGLSNCDIKNCASLRVSSILTTGHKRLLEDHQVAKLLEIKENMGSCEVFDLEIDDPTHSFIANNAIVHNSVCSTRIMTGHGVPQLSAIMEVADSLQKYRNNVSIIADGGIRYASDIVKSIAAGADGVMIGSLLSGTDEAAGERIVENGVAYKTYRGMASREAQTEKKPGQVPRVEGVSVRVPCRGPVADTLADLEAGIRSGLSYSGATNLAELRHLAEFVVVSGNTLKENHPHHPYRL